MFQLKMFEIKIGKIKFGKKWEEFGKNRGVFGFIEINFAK